MTKFLYSTRISRSEQGVPLEINAPVQDSECFIFNKFHFLDNTSTEAAVMYRKLI